MKKLFAILITILLCPIIVKADVYSPTLGDRLLGGDITIIFIILTISIIIYLLVKNKKGKK